MGRGRKVESVLSELPEPTESQEIVRVTGTPGGNLVQVTDEASRTFLARVPSKFRNVIWIRIGGYLIVEREADEEAEGREVGKVQATLVHYLYRDQIRHLQSRSLWPSAFADGDGAAAADEYGSEALHTNTNHAFRDLPPSSDESEGGEEGEEEEEEEEELDALGNSVVRRG
ncbi:hypothetical protein EMIHUDRAFT_122911 [Emiliania huxleyi CCMP1516]|uniref:S1-like domain-containing protein n=2 Tax=Emiliania huxleyi TaxID=2903 RepID=A0A0D3KC07_EMIH1|nr:hypothetical protein EMIHUDRAFT_122911 [Emiliania huxleyi CCMP1516]EOD33292.1 hypothetical protein EMIHUDRAFT_122911 [Emiliania huxleyi CCMP1516]|eukprot:XP_005785721.1 hypothetical protein EMIHUDRAFT_122911 [Emiliania huxleyi CCMP1516]